MKAAAKPEEKKFYIDISKARRESYFEALNRKALRPGEVAFVRFFGRCINVKKL